MASFNPDIQPTNDPSYLNQSKEYTKHDFPDSTLAGKATKYDSLFSGLTSMIKNGVSAIDSGIKDRIKNDVYQGVDALRGAQGVDLAAIQAGAGGEPLNLDKGGNPNAKNPLEANKPPQPDVIQEGISRLQAAKDQGKISDTNYYAQLEAMTRSVRSRFPGYREEVDAMVHSVTGVTPANALRNSLLHDMAQAEAGKDAAGKDFKHHVASNGQYLPADYWDRASNGNPYSEVETRKIIDTQKANDYRIQSAGHALDYEAKQGKNVEDKAESFARDKTSTLSTGIISKVEPLINQVIQDQAKGKIYTPEEQNALRAQANQFRSSTVIALEKAFNEEVSPGGKTLNSLVNTEKKKAIIDEQMKIFDVVDQHLFDKDKGALNTAMNTVKAMQEGTHLDILQKYPAIKAMEAIGSVPGGAKVLSELATIPQSGVSKTLSTQMQHLFNSMNMVNLTGGKITPTGTTSVDEQLKDVQALPGGTKPAALRTYIDNWSTLLTNPNIPAEQKSQAAGVFFNQNNMKFLEKFQSGDRLEIFQKLVTPQITQEMAKVKGPAWESYAQWAKNAFTTIYRQAGDGVGSAPDSPFWKVTLNEKSSQFELSPTPEGIRFVNQQGKTASGFSVVQALSRLTGSDISSNIDKINAGIRSIKPVLEAEGHGTSEEVKKLTNFMSQYDKKNPNFWQWILKGAVPKEPDVPPEKQTFGGTHPSFTQASGGNESTRGLLSITSGPTEAIDAIKSTFSKGESGDNYNRLVDTPTHPKEAPLTSMSIGEVLNYQKGMLKAGNKSSAAGKYQIVSTTLKSLVDEGVAKMTDIYDENTQERLADALLERRGLSKFLDGRMGWRDFVHNLGDEWEIIKKSPRAVKNLTAALEAAKDDKIASK